MAAAGFGILLLTLVIRDQMFRETCRYTLQGIALYPIFFFCVARPRAFLVRLLTWQPLRYIGIVSYTLYLCHEAILDVLRDIFHEGRPMLAVLAFPVCLLFGWAMRSLIENPIRKIRNRMA
jgi:peptidoglycan/LPS O-acetylase OafA/YrhL